MCHPDIGVGVDFGSEHQRSFPSKFYLIGKALSGELSCSRTGLDRIYIRYVLDEGPHHVFMEKHAKKAHAWYF